MLDTDFDLKDYVIDPARIIAFPQTGTGPAQEVAAAVCSGAMAVGGAAAAGAAGEHLPTCDAAAV
jgi:hypothetical protein